MENIYYPPEDLQPKLCKFLFKYAIDKKKKSDKALGVNFLKDFKSAMNHPTKIIKTISNGDNKEILSIKKNANKHTEFFYQMKTNSNETELFCFLRHVRNAIAHGTLREDGEFFVLEDLDCHNNYKLTAAAKIHKTKLNSIIDSYLK